MNEIGKARSPESLPDRPEEVVSLDDFECVARGTLAQPLYDFIAGGAGDELTLAENRHAFGRWHLVPRTLRELDVPPELATTVLGQEIAMPVLVAPVGYQREWHSDGDAGIARAAEAAGTGVVLSSMSNHSHHEVAAAAPGVLRWAQLFAFRDPGLTREVLDRAVAEGYSAIVLTVDGIVNGLRERDIRSAFTLSPDLPLPCLPSALTATPLRPAAVAETIETRLGWGHVDYCREASGLPVVLKGILSPLDAREAVARGCEGIIVSNHGGRQLDGVAATIDALPAIAERVAGDLELYVDGGVRRGTDIVKALALGARAVLVGRPVAFALASFGEAGVRRLFEILGSELSNALSLAGAGSVGDAERITVYRDPPLPVVSW